jgi:hypothetical protein
VQLKINKILLTNFVINKICLSKPEYCLDTTAILQSTVTSHPPVTDTVEDNVTVVVCSGSHVQTHFDESNHPNHQNS